MGAVLLQCLVICGLLGCRDDRKGGGCSGRTRAVGSRLDVKDTAVSPSAPTMTLPSGVTLTHPHVSASCESAPVVASSASSRMNTPTHRRRLIQKNVPPPFLSREDGDR